MRRESSDKGSRKGDYSKTSRMLSGTNNVPLGSRRDNSEGTSIDQHHFGNSEASHKWAGEQIREHRSQRITDDEVDGSERRSSYSRESGQRGSGQDRPADANSASSHVRRRTRWGRDNQKNTLMMVSTVIPSSIPIEQIDAYVVQMRLEEINQRLRSGSYVPQDRERSPSPEPVYGADGKRVNTREYRYKRKLENERHKLVEVCIKTIPNFKPPPDYKRPTKISDKIYIPVKDYPEINFIGQLIGPRGTTLKRIENDSGAKISIRGKGSVKEGKSRADGALIPGEEEDLHCLITADSEDKVHKAMKAIEKVIETAASVPEGQNELKRMQLRYLAELNGTLRDDENQICSNCGAVGHRRSDCPEQKNVTVNMVCRVCNSAGHTARDCMQKNNVEVMKEAAQRDKRLDSEYANLMAELGEFGYDSSDPNNAGSHGKSSGSQLPWVKRPPWATTPTTQPSGQTNNQSFIPQWIPRTDPSAQNGTIPQMMHGSWAPQFPGEGDQNAYKNIYAQQTAQPQGWDLQEAITPPGYPSIPDASAYGMQHGFPIADTAAAQPYPQNAWNMIALSMMQQQQQPMIYGATPPPPPPPWAPPPPPPPPDPPAVTPESAPGNT